MKYLGLTIDIESDAAAFADARITSFRGVQEGLRDLLEFLAKKDLPAALFICCDILNYVDIDLIKESGNLVEIASHGLKHSYPPSYIMSIEKKEQLHEIVQSKVVLEKTLSREINGFRANGLCITTELMNCVSQYYKYDSSLMFSKRYENSRLNISHPYHPSPVNMCNQGSMNVLEIPVSCANFLGVSIPAVGAYVRALPLFVFRSLRADVVIFDLHCQDPVPFKYWKYYSAKNYFNKLDALTSQYQSVGYKSTKLSSLLKIFSRVGNTNGICN